MIDPNAPAYPVSRDEMNQSDSAHGLTIRAEIAGRILAGLLANASILFDNHNTHQLMARQSVMAADALIAALNNEPT